MNTDQHNVGAGYWLAWLCASAMGYGVGMILGLSVAYGLFDRDVFDATIGITVGVVAGAAGGLAQWIVLREQVARSGLWVPATAPGFGIALGTAAMSSGQNYYLEAGVRAAVLFGVAGGTLQWLVLRRAQIPRAGLWIAANVPGSLSIIAGIFVADSIGRSGNYTLSAMVLGLLFGLGIGAINGAVLVWLLRQSPSRDAEGLAAAHQ